MGSLYFGVSRAHILIPESLGLVKALGIMVFYFLFFIEGALYIIHDVLVCDCLRLLLPALHKDKRLDAGQKDDTGHIFIYHTPFGDAIIRQGFIIEFRAEETHHNRDNRQPHDILVFHVHSFAPFII
jgi:hypothetical protein